jgi:hypothetical protein
MRRAAPGCAALIWIEGTTYQIGFGGSCMVTSPAGCSWTPGAAPGEARQSSRRSGARYVFGVDYDQNMVDAAVSLDVFVAIRRLSRMRQVIMSRCSPTRWGNR